MVEIKSRLLNYQPHLIIAKATNQVEAAKFVIIMN